MSDEKRIDGEQAECGDVNEVFGPGVGPVCTKPAGHDGDHIATDRTQTRPGYPGGTVVSRWAREGATSDRQLCSHGFDFEIHDCAVRCDECGHACVKHLVDGGCLYCGCSAFAEPAAAEVLS